MSVLDKFRLDGKVAVVTGASKNIGKEISRAFAEAGAIVYMNARGEEILERAAEEIRSETGAEIHTVAADISTPEGTELLVEAVHKAHSQLHVLVNNAMAEDPYIDPLAVEDKDWQWAFEGNVTGPYRLCKGFGRKMIDGDGGSIINMCSGVGILPNPGYVPITYGATKAAMWMMTRYLAFEWGQHNVRVNGLVPGTVKASWEGWGSLVPEDEAKMSELMAKIPLGRLGHPTELAPAALYLASDASTYTTGTLLICNGGRPW